GRDAPSRVAVQPLGFLNCLPPLLERRQVPPLAVATDDPQTTLCSIEREAPPHGERLERLVAAQVLLAEETGRVHGSVKTIVRMRLGVSRKERGGGPLARRLALRCHSTRYRTCTGTVIVGGGGGKPGGGGGEPGGGGGPNFSDISPALGGVNSK